MLSSHSVLDKSWRYAKEEIWKWKPQCSNSKFSTQNCYWMESVYLF
jgi:hypothetical protein